MHSLYGDMTVIKYKQTKIMFHSNENNKKLKIKFDIGTQRRHYSCHVILNERRRTETRQTMVKFRSLFQFNLI